MNVFFLHKDPWEAASMMCDKHVCKMPLESAQMLCTAHRVADEVGHIAGKIIYKLAHKNHPSSVWARSSTENYSWLYRHFLALSDEFYKRYGKKHLSDKKFSFALSHLPKNVPYGEFTEPPQCMPDEYKQSDTVSAYRAYYSGEKRYMARWDKGTVPPKWWDNMSIDN